MNKCRHCGFFVPVEKAFCPNCSEPIEPEEAPNRAASFTSEMMATMRDDPDNYKEMLALKRQLKSTGSKETPPPGPAPAPAPSTSTANAAPSYVAPGVAPPAKGGKRNLVPVIVVVSILILALVLLLVFKVI